MQENEIVTNFPMYIYYNLFIGLLAFLPRLKSNKKMHKSLSSFLTIYKYEKTNIYYEGNIKKKTSTFRIIFNICKDEV